MISPYIRDLNQTSLNGRSSDVEFKAFGGGLIVPFESICGFQVWS
jgi:hypothetical protein